MDWALTCEVCGRQEPLESAGWRCPACGGAFAFKADPKLALDDLDTRDTTLWRYRSVFPPTIQTGAAVGAGMTPLVQGELGGREVWFKLDSLLPTGSFKDRGAAVFCAHLQALGRRQIIIDSSGNAAAAYSAYGAANGLQCSVYAPATTSPAKLVQSRAFGSQVHPVPGNRDDVANAAQQAAADDTAALYASHNWHPVFVEGVKTWAIEVWEQLGRRMPGTVFVPTGGGSALVGARRGFQALDGPQPAIVAAQPAACSPVVAAIDSGADMIAPVTPGSTIAEGTKIGAPARRLQILEAIRGTDGWATAVTEEALIEALRMLFAQGIYAEPTGALGAAACLAAIRECRSMDPGPLVVLVTGHGLKATETVAQIIGN